jgi:hypothetical protein
MPITGSLWQEATKGSTLFFTCRRYFPQNPELLQQQKHKPHQQNPSTPKSRPLEQQYRGLTDVNFFLFRISKLFA